jgi:hypothetical protein
LTGKRARRQRAGRAAFLARSGLKRRGKKKQKIFFFFFLICKLYLTKKLKARYKNTKNVLPRSVPKDQDSNIYLADEFLDALEGFWLKTKGWVCFVLVGFCWLVLFVVWFEFLVGVVIWFCICVWLLLGGVLLCCLRLFW